LSAVRSGKTIGLANKEALVMAGKILMSESRLCHAKIIPVDSEHSAVFQCIEGYRKSSVRSIILTASGGPFATRRPAEMAAITPEEALNHPSWKMGKKITIDSATLMNKGFEVIEAHHLFGLPHGSIDVVIHPQSIVHSIVEFKDRSCLAQLSVPDMKGPIAYALAYPQRIDDVMRGLALHEIGTLTFSKPDQSAFPCLSYAYRALEAGGTMPSVLNAANEVAVHAFLKGIIRFTEIPVVIRLTMEGHSLGPDTSLEAVLEADRWARITAEKIIKTL
jgi:1-deoxy-D-xylulose-5-phosphate reductoisomerase